MSARSRFATRVKGFVSFAAGVMWDRIFSACRWVAEWAAEKTFGDAAYRQLSDTAAAAMTDTWWPLVVDWAPRVVLLCLGLYLFLRPEKSLAKQEDAPVSINESLIDSQEAEVLINVQIIDLPKIHISDGQIDQIDFFPGMSLIPREGRAGDPARFLPEDWDIGLTYRLRIVLISNDPIFDIKFHFIVKYNEVESSDDGSSRTVGSEAIFEENKIHKIMRLNRDEPHDIWLYTQANSQVFVRFEENITATKSGTKTRIPVAIKSYTGVRAISLGPAIQGATLSRQLLSGLEKRKQL